MKSVFEVNPEINTLYVFEDGNAFAYKGHAENHKRQTGKDYEMVEREKEEVKTIKPKK